MRCHRCNEPMTLYVVGEDYCKPCVRELAVRAQSDAKRSAAAGRFRFPKLLGDPRTAA